MTTFYLIRHGANDFIARGIAGRMPGIHLNAEGRRQSDQLVLKLKDKPIRHIFCSPLERTRETAEPLARALNLEIQVSEAIHEVNFGDWNGKTLDELASIPLWKTWNQFRSGVQVPNGELMTQVQSRVVTFLQKLRKDFPDQHIALFSHGDPIRSALVYFMGAPLDLLTRLEVEPGSINILGVDDWGAKVYGINL